MHDLEQHRLRSHGEQELKNTRELCDELLSAKILPGMVAALLGSFREDVDLAIEGRDDTAKGMIA